MGQSLQEIGQYLGEVKAAVKAGNYRIERNRRRKDNMALYRDYVIDEAKSREILLGLAAADFSEILQNEHRGFEHEHLYVFGKDVRLLQRFGAEDENVPLYVKLNKLENHFVIVISFHKQEHPLTYAFQ